MPSLIRHKAKRIAIYNHKGGVGKTTLTANIAAALASQDNNVLIVDSDPQCNLTSYFYADDVVNDLLEKSDTNKGRTIWTALKPVAEALGEVTSIKLYETSIDNLWLLPGDIRLAEFELCLNEFWRDCLDRKAKGYRGTSSLSALVNTHAEEIDADFVFYDTGPNIGPLNRMILLDCDYFIIPAACDLFSIRAFKTLGHTLSDWIQDWKTILQLAPNDIYLMPGMPKFLGYILQGFKIYRGVISSVSSGYIPKIQKAIFNDVISVLHNIDSSLAIKTTRGIKIGEVKDFSSLATASQFEGVPFYESRGGTRQQRTSAQQTFNKIADYVMEKAI